MIRAPETRYARAADGIHVGYQVVGSGPVDLVFVPYDYSNIEAACDFPPFVSFVRALASILTCVDPRRLDASFAGRDFDESLLRDLPEGVDPCGENGEFHTLVFEGPIFAGPIRVEVGEVVTREGFVFCDVFTRSEG